MSHVLLLLKRRGKEGLCFLFNLHHFHNDFFYKFITKLIEPVINWQKGALSLMTV